MAALSALVSGLDAELVRLGYKDSTMVWSRGCWRRLQRYFAAYPGIATGDLPEWNQDPGLLDWRTSL